MPDMDALRAVFPAADVKWRTAATWDVPNGRVAGAGPGRAGRAVPYVDARAIQDRLDDVCGPAGWTFELRHVESRDAEGKPLGVVVGRLALCIDGQWVAKEDGAGASDVEPAKGGISDAMRRAAVQWGIGRYLYRFPGQTVRLEQRGRSHVIPADELNRLAAFYTKHLGGQQVRAASGEQVDPDTGEVGETPPRADTNSATHPATHAGVNAVMNVIARGAPAGTRPADIKEATAIALSVRPSEINKDIMADFLAAWLEQPGNTASAFQKKFLQALTELRERELSPA